MSSIREISTRFLAVCTFAVVVSVALGKEKTLYVFHGGSDGALPLGAVIEGGAGNLYGTTELGGGGTLCQNIGSGGCGTVFKLAADGTEVILYAFTGGSDGAYPIGGPVADSKGDLYGTASSGGASNDGTVFKIAPDDTETTLYTFQSGSGGVRPAGALIIDQSGNFYGMTTGGGSYSGSNCAEFGCGVVFELTSAGKEIVLYTFQGGTDGWNPVGSLITDSGGNLYGSTLLGGANCQNDSLGCGTVFKIAPDGTETQLYVFQGQSTGDRPSAGLLADAAGNFYGTTGAGGTGTSCGDGCGTVYKLAPDGTETVLYSFQGGNDGSAPESSLIMDKGGNLYGTTFYGGSTGCKRGGCGTVFKLAPNGAETVLARLGGERGKYPAAALLQHKGILYGTATSGGIENDGVVFSLKK